MKKNSAVSEVRYFILIVVKQNSVVTVVSEENSVVSAVSEEKQRSKRSQIFHFNSSEVKQGSGCSQ